MASFLCGLAPTLKLLILFRVIQGLTGGCLQPLSQAVLLEAFTPEDRGKAMGFWGLGIVVAPILGPVLGGWLTDSYSWRWVFYINIPVGIVSLIMTHLFIFDPPYIRRGSGRIDYWGIGLLAGGAFTLFWYGQLSLNAGYWDFFWPQFIQGIATVTTMLARRQQILINVLGEGVNSYDPGTRSLLYQLRAGFMARGSDAFTATRRAYAAVFGLVERQAAMLSFVQIFRFLGIVFLIMIPLIFLMKNPKHGRGPVSAGH